MRYNLFVFLIMLSSAVIFHNVKADVYFSQPNSNGFIFFENIRFGHYGYSFQGDDGTVHSFAPFVAPFMADFAGYEQIYFGSVGQQFPYPISTTTEPSYISSISLDIRDIDVSENNDYALQYWCFGLHDEFLGSITSDYINSSNFTGDFKNISFNFTDTKCDLNKNKIHNIVWNLKGVGPVSGTQIQVRFQNVNTINGFGVANDNGNIIDDYEPKIEIHYSLIQTEINPVLIIPGILGTEIINGNEKLWPDLSRLSLPNSSDIFMDALSYKIDGTPLVENLSVGNVLGKVTINSDYSQKLIDSFIQQGYELNKNLFLFPYDWRKDLNEVALGELKNKIDDIFINTGTQKIDLIAHSQGGLVVKSLLFNQPTYQHKINKLIFVGTPNLGAPKATKALIYGDDLDISFLGLGLDYQEVKNIGQNMPSLYELLPSQEYFNHIPFYASHLKYNFFNFGINKDLNYVQTKQFLADNNLNINLLNSSENFHSSSFDNFDLSNTGIQTYNIVGCQEPTLDHITFKDFGPPKRDFGSGDGTVPLVSANNVLGAQVFYSLKSTHSTMLTDASILNKILNIITGSLNASPNISSDITSCHFNGIQVSSHSPVNLNIYDEDGNHLGLDLDGKFENGIPDSAYDIVNHDTTAFLPKGHTYKVKLLATGSGVFGFDSSLIQEGVVKNTAHYDNVGISAQSVAIINLNEYNNQIIQLDTNGDGVVDQTIEPDSILNENESKDLVPPLSTSTIEGLMGEENFYRSNATITLTAIDPIIDNDPSKTSGILAINYKLDGGDYQKCLSALPSTEFSANCSVFVKTEGTHTLSFFSTDRAGNNEQEQNINFVIDKTPPELNIMFNPLVQDLDFTGLDNLSTSSDLTLYDLDDLVKVADQAGNTTELKFKDKNRKTKLKAEAKSLAYNGVLQDISKLNLNFSWQFDKDNIIKALNQHIKSKGDFNIAAEYKTKTNKTKLEGRDDKGKINNLLNGLVLLSIQTKNGNFIWNY